MLSPSRERAPDRFLAWLDSADGDGLVFLSVVTVHEIEKGVALLDRKGATAKADGLRLWLAGLLAAYGDKILGLDGRAASLSGRMEARAIAAGHGPGIADAMIAGVAQAHGLVVVTRNARHFCPFGIPIATPDAAEGVTMS